MDRWLDVAVYIFFQCFGGICGGFTAGALYAGKSFSLEPGPGYTWVEVGAVEVLYTFVLTFVVLNVACATANQFNQYYGLAIGFVIVAAGYAIGGISGAVLNPAVALGIDIPAFGLKGGFGWSFVYAAYELLGAALGAIAFRLVRPEEW